MSITLNPNVATTKQFRIYTDYEIINHYPLAYGVIAQIPDTSNPQSINEIIRNTNVRSTVFKNDINVFKVTRLILNRINNIYIYI